MSEEKQEQKEKPPVYVMTGKDLSGLTTVPCIEMPGGKEILPDIRGFSFVADKVSLMGEQNDDGRTLISIGFEGVTLNMVYPLDDGHWPPRLNCKFRFTTKNSQGYNITLLFSEFERVSAGCGLSEDDIVADISYVLHGGKGTMKTLLPRKHPLPKKP